MNRLVDKLRWINRALGEHSIVQGEGREGRLAYSLILDSKHRYDIEGANEVIVPEVFPFPKSIYSHEQ